MNYMSILNSVVNKKQHPKIPQLSEKCPFDLIKLIENCWAWNPDERLSLGEAIEILMKMDKNLNPLPTDNLSM